MINGIMIDVPTITKCCIRQAMIVVMIVNVVVVVVVITDCIIDVNTVYSFAVRIIVIDIGLIVKTSCT